MSCIPCKMMCPFCGHQWVKRKLNPLRCPFCGHKLRKRKK